MKGTLLSLLLAASFAIQAQDWTNNFFPGQYDVNGKYIGGTEVMCLTPHKGKLYAATSYVCDLNNATLDLSGGTPILVLDSANGQWKQEILFESVLLIPSLKEIIFTKDYLGNSIQPDTILITGPNSKKQILVYSRNDETGTWIKDSITAVPGNVEIRSIGTHYDQITGHQYIFIGVSDYGIWKGEYNPSLPSKIQWESVPEFTTAFNSRVPAIADVNGKMYFGVTEHDTWTSRIYRRIDGPSPTYEEVFSGTDGYQLDIRGFTSVNSPSGGCCDLWFYWNDYFRRLQPQKNDSVVNELKVSSDLSTQSGRVFSDNITAAYNDHQFRWKDPSTGDSVMLIGLQAKYDSAWLATNPQPNVGGRTIDGMYYSRKQVGSNITYQLHYIVNNTPQVIDTLLATRTICQSPFPEDSGNVLYAGGYHTNAVWLNNTAWVYRGSFNDLATYSSPDASGNFQVSVYPNPAYHAFLIDVAGFHFDLSICDVSGRKLFEKKNIFDRVEVDCSNFSHNIYFIYITIANHGIISRKVIVSE